MTTHDPHDFGNENTKRCALCTIQATPVYYFDDGSAFDLCSDCYGDALNNGAHWLRSQLDERADRTPAPTIRSLEPVEGRTSYEWVDEEHGDRMRVRWSQEQRRWVAEMIPPGCRNYHVYGGSAHYCLASAIARLANLQKPEGA